MKFGVSLGISNNIWVGNLNKKGNMFLSKEDKTLDAINAVVKIIESNDAKNMTTEIVDSEYRYILSVKRIKKENK